MALKDIYKNSIEREFNPVVSVRDNDAETLRIEIEEYIFTDEIINGLYTVLDTICHRKNHYDGIWINGYYGSGK